MLRTALLIIDLIILIFGALGVYLAIGLTYRDPGQEPEYWLLIIPVLLGVVLVTLFILGKKRKLINYLYFGLGILILLFEVYLSFGRILFR